MAASSDFLAHLYVGTFTGTGFNPTGSFEADGKGIHVFELSADGALAEKSVHEAGYNPTYLCTDPDKQFLYAVNEIHDKDGFILTYAIDQTTGSLSLLSPKVSCRGTACCHVSATRQFVVAANYLSGSVILFRRQPNGLLTDAVSFDKHAQDSGSGVNPGRQEAPHAHQVALTPDGRHVLVPDLGADLLRVYQLLDDPGTLVPATEPPVAFPPGSGPRHLVFDPTTPSRFFIVCELLSFVIPCTFDPETQRVELGVACSSLPADVKVGVGGDSFCAAIRISSDGKNLYVSNRGHNSLTHFRVGNDGALDRKGTTPVGGIPRDFTIVDPFVIVGNQDGGKLVVFKMDETTGSLTAVGEPVACSWPATLLAVQP
eukprot:m.60013 g.60013  ORF g.60013 m.60013 type:complete len:372 (-) comp13046_c0_seq2:153-1268(-)